MILSDLLTEEGVFPSLDAHSKKQLLQELARHAEPIAGISAREIYDTMLQRERLSSTGLGRGIAIPHVKLAALGSIVCIFARLPKPIDFESLDGEPVDLIFLLLAPEHASGDHLKALARISRLVREPPTLERLRAAKDKAAIIDVLSQPIESHAA